MRSRIDWDYGEVAAAFTKRPPYAPGALAAVLAAIGASTDTRVCDVGAGTGNLTVPLAAAGLQVVAVEPSASMRAIGTRRTRGLNGVRWIAALGEAMALRDRAFDTVTFGSSFNCMERCAALAEAARLLRRRGSIACLWNHRDRRDPLQARVEARIRELVPEYDEGTRRGDQTATIETGGLFGDVTMLEHAVVHRVLVTDCIDAWRSHLTLRRQARERFDVVVAAIAAELRASGAAVMDVPYVTRAWVARRR